MIKVILEIDAESLADLRKDYGSLLDALIAKPGNGGELLTNNEVNVFKPAKNTHVAEVVEDSVELSETSLEELNLPSSCMGTLECNGILTIGDVVTTDIGAMMDLFSATLESYKELLRRLGLWLAFNQNAILDKWLFDAETKLATK